MTVHAVGKNRAGDEGSDRLYETHAGGARPFDVDVRFARDPSSTGRELPIWLPRGPQFVPLPLKSKVKSSRNATAMSSGTLKENDLTVARFVAMVDDVPILRRTSKWSEGYWERRSAWKAHNLFTFPPPRRRTLESVLPRPAKETRRRKEQPNQRAGKPDGENASVVTEDHIINDQCLRIIIENPERNFLLRGRIPSRGVSFPTSNLLQSGGGPYIIPQSTNRQGTPPHQNSSLTAFFPHDVSRNIHSASGVCRACYERDHVRAPDVCARNAHEAPSSVLRPRASNRLPQPRPLSRRATVSSPPASGLEWMGSKSSQRLRAPKKMGRSRVPQMCETGNEKQPRIGSRPTQEALIKKKRPKSLSFEH